MKILFLVSNDRNSTQIYFVHVTSRLGVKLIPEVAEVHVFNKICISFFVSSLPVHLALSVSLCPCMFLSVCLSVCLQVCLCLPCWVSHCITASLSLFFLCLFELLSLFICTSLSSMFLFVSIFCISLSHHLTLNPISVSLVVYLYLYLPLPLSFPSPPLPPHVSSMSTRILTILAEILIGSTW